MSFRGSAAVPVTSMAELQIDSVVPRAAGPAAAESFDLVAWLATIDAKMVAVAAVLKENSFDSPKALVLLTESDCKELGLTLFQRRMLLSGIDKLKAVGSGSGSGSGAADPARAAGSASQAGAASLRSADWAGSSPAVPLGTPLQEIGIQWASLSYSNKVLMRWVLCAVRA